MSSLNLNTGAMAAVENAQRQAHIDTAKTQALSTRQAMEEAKNMAAVEAAAKDFEAVFITEMLRPMFDGIEVDKRFGGGRGEEVFRSMMIDEYGKAVAEAGGIGMADHIKAELLKAQEKSAQ